MIWRWHRSCDSHSSGSGGRGCGGLGAGARRGAGLHAEVAHQRAMIREAHVRYAKIRDLDALAHQDEVELDAWDARRERGQAGGVRAAEPGRTHEEIDLVRTPEGVEVARHDHGLARLQDQVVERAQLVLALPELQRQVHEEHAHVRQLELDDEALDAGVEIVEALTVHVRRGQEGVALLADDRHELVDRVCAVLALESRVVPELGGDVLGLVKNPRTNRTRVDLHQADDIGLHGPQKLGNAGEHFAVAAKVAGTRYRQMECRARAGGVAYVVDEQSHLAGKPAPEDSGVAKTRFYRGEASRAVSGAPSPRNARVARRRRGTGAVRVSR